MNDEKILEMINKYYDGELEKGEEIFLFTQLSLSDEGRKYFKQLNRIRAAIDNSVEEFPEELEGNILRSISKVSETKSGFLTTHTLVTSISYAFALILIIISGYLLLEVKGYQNKVENLSDRMIKQSQTIEMLYNSLPEIQVKASSNDEIIVKPKI
jgi:predicted PurR-regulated permease PerM